MNTTFTAILFLFLSVQQTFSLLPKPFLSTKYESQCTLKLPLKISHPYDKCPILEEALRRLILRLNKEAIHSTNAFTSKCGIDKLTIEIKQGCDNNNRHSTWPSETMNEECNALNSFYFLINYHPDKLKIQNGQVVIQSEELWGTLWALESFSQLVHSGPQGSDAMSMVKMNVLHWHIVDDNSFPYVSLTYPNLSAQGAFDPKNYIYTQANVKEVLEYARYRGIRVMVEIDTPGHTYSWGKGYPSLLTKCYEDDKPTDKYGPLNPIQDFTYEFVQKLFDEFLNQFQDSYLHLGGDEVEKNCWKSNPEIKKFMNVMGFGEDYSKLQSYYISKVIDIVNKMGKAKSRNISTVVWEEVFTEGYTGKDKPIIHVWKSATKWAELVFRATKAGYRVLLSSCWYLNYINYGDDWKNFYRCDPLDFPGDETQKSLVIGGEAAMWGEYVDDTNLISRSWPRGAIPAERLWSFVVDKQQDFIPRLNELRCKMLRRGIEAEPITGPGFCMK